MLKPIIGKREAISFTGFAFERASGRLRLHYEIDGDQLEEVLVFPGEWSEAAELRAKPAFAALHLLAGISYYKAWLPKQIQVRSMVLNHDQALFWSNLYTQGLGEFFYRNQLEGRAYVNFTGDTDHVRENLMANGVALNLVDQPIVLEQLLTSRPILPLGGGKDSLVVYELLKTAGITPELVTLREQLRTRAVADVLGEELTVIERQLDPKLLEWNQAGAWNGHVPITAYISFVMSAYALLKGEREVIFANERSANIGNVMVDGWEINHQYSKSLECELAIQNYLNKYVNSELRVFSLLRPWSELAVVKYLVAKTAPDKLAVISSCNKNFTLSGVGAERWCGECPKCLFVFALFAAWLSVERVMEIFGGNMMESDIQLGLWQELVGVKGIKPFECVGEPAEVKVALWLATRRSEWSQSMIGEWFKKEIEPKLTDPKLTDPKLTDPKLIDPNLLLAITLAPGSFESLPIEYRAISAELGNQLNPLCV